MSATTFKDNSGKPLQEIQAYNEECFEQIDASSLDVDELHRQVVKAYRSPIILERGPVFRMRLFTRSNDENILLVVGHHIVFDGWSFGVFFDELGALYAAERTDTPSTLPPLKRQYRDYVAWQAEMLAGPVGERLWRFWKGRLSGQLPVLGLPTDKPRPIVSTYGGATHNFTLGGPLSCRIKALATSAHTTIYTVLMAAFQVLLFRYTGQEDIVVGSPVVGRRKGHFMRIVGHFINMVPIRGTLSRHLTFRALLRQLHEMIVAALAHQDYPFGLMVERLRLTPDPSRSPIFQTTLNFQKLRQLGELGKLFAPDDMERSVDWGA